MRQFEDTKNKIPEFDAEELTLVELAQEYADEDKARALLESLLWPNGPICPRCHFDEVYKITPRPDSKSPNRKGVYKCAACRQYFTVTVGTILEDSHLPISRWLMAFFILCASKKSVSAHQLHRLLGSTYKTVWFMAHRIRYSMGPTMPLGKLAGSNENALKSKRLSLRGVKFEDAVRAFMQTPPLTSKKVKKQQKKN